MRPDIGRRPVPAVVLNDGDLQRCARAELHRTPRTDHHHRAAERCQRGPIAGEIRIHLHLEGEADQGPPSHVQTTERTGFHPFASIADGAATSPPGVTP